MIKSNLATLLAERNLKITKASEDTGISRTTLTSLASGNAQGIQFDTIDNLCIYLSVAPGDLFLYVPFDIVLLTSDFEYGEGVVEFLVTTKSGRKNYYMGIYIDSESSKETGAFTLDTVRIKTKVGIDICPCSDPREDGKRVYSAPSHQSAEFYRYYEALPVAIDISFQKSIVERILHSLNLNPLETDAVIEISGAVG